MIFLHASSKYISVTSKKRKQFLLLVSSPFHLLPTINGRGTAAITTWLFFNSHSSTWKKSISKASLVDAPTANEKIMKKCPIKDFKMKQLTSEKTGVRIDHFLTKLSAAVASQIRGVMLTVLVLISCQQRYKSNTPINSLKSGLKMPSLEKSLSVFHKFFLIEMKHNWPRKKQGRGSYIPMLPHLDEIALKK